MKSWTPPTNEMIEKVLSSVKKETDRQYFFCRLKNPLWIKPLCDLGYFKNPPNIRHLPNGRLQCPNWPELSYLVTVSEIATNQVINIILDLPKTDNPRIYDDILSIAIKLKGKESARLYQKLIEYSEIENQFLAHRYPDLLQHWIINNLYSEALGFIKKVILFYEDPQKNEKEEARKKGSKSLNTLLEPAPQHDQWDYQKLLEKGVRPLAKKVPDQISYVLINTVSDMIKMGLHSEYLDKGKDEDFSEIWCHNFKQFKTQNPTTKEVLVHTLGYACKNVYDNVPASINALDQALRNQQWKVFKRLRQYLYALHPNKQTLPWIREFILAHDNYSKWEYQYEFQLMIRKACECFGSKLLNENEKETIFNRILTGPSKKQFREWMGEQYTDKLFLRRQHNFHYKQLHPFKTLLTGECRSYFDELENKDYIDTVTDDTYSSYGKITSGTVNYRSPKSSKELDKLSDEDLLTYLNEWDEEYREKDNWLIEINISALSSVFQTLFKEKIILNNTRLSFWMSCRDNIERPIYIVSMLKVMKELTNEKNFNNLNQWIEFCLWVLSHSDSPRKENDPIPQDESRDHPDWGTSRRVVVEFIKVCVSKDVNVPITFREDLTNLLQLVCNQFDWRLDHDQPVLLNQYDPITEAINNTRSCALESLLNFGFWIRRYLPTDPVKEISTVLSKRIDKNSEFPLTHPEYALLGMHFEDLYILDLDWTTKQKNILFLKENESIWMDVFSSYIRFNRPSRRLFYLLLEDFEYALENLNILIKEKNNNGFVDRLGQYFFSYYLWGIYPLTDTKSLLQSFYDKTNDNRQRWAQLFNHVGYSFGNSNTNIDEKLIDQAIAYFDWRFEIAEPIELQKFTFWLSAKCFDPEWRLQSYMKILTLLKQKSVKDVGIFMELGTLTKLLPDHLILVVNCFAKITEMITQETQIYISINEAKPILKAGLESKDPQTRKNAKQAQENLLNLGCFDYLDLE